jgi:anhydro-N-acetylmuramic acid kinase
MTKTYHVIGLMSGTSLDGLDIAFCEFGKVTEKWQFAIKNAETIAYTEQLKKKLRDVYQASAYQYVCLNQELGEFFGYEVNRFIEKNQIQADFISSHGHTVFHQPQRKLTTQIGNGATIAAICKLPVVCDFRTKDVALGGQGAPLVPIGDELLFSAYHFCLNLGGIANISTKNEGKRIAFDICHTNIVLNYLANLLNLEYDKDGKAAAQGNFETAKPIFEQLNRLSFYAQKPPKSLGRELFIEQIKPIIDTYLLAHQNSKQAICDLLCCFSHHIAFQIAQITGAAQSLFEPKQIETTSKKMQMLATGGGVLNHFLVKQIEIYNPAIDLVLPNIALIQFKEALIFAFLGVLRWQQENNCLQTVTGAKEDNCGGCIYV